MVAKKKRGRPKKVLTLTDPSEKLDTSVDDARVSLEAVIASYRKKSTEQGLHEDDVKSLTSAIDSLIKLGKEERDIGKQYQKLSDDELLKLAKKAARVLKQKKQVIIK